MKLWKFKVSGKGRFPVDMLRYDNCWPIESEDATKILDQKTDRTLGIGRPQRSIELYTHRKGGPTIDRWKSFGWNCWIIQKND